MNRPWFQLHSRDWLDNKELRRCSGNARALLADLMCLASEGTPHGYLRDDVGPLTEKYMAFRCTVTIAGLRRYLSELIDAKRVAVHESGSMFIPRMVRDEEIRLKRAAGGSLGGNPNLTPKSDAEGYPSLSKEGKAAPRTRTDVRSDSDSVVSSKLVLVLEKKNADSETSPDPQTRIRALCLNLAARHPGNPPKLAKVETAAELCFADDRAKDPGETVERWCEKATRNHDAHCVQWADTKARRGQDYAVGLVEWFASGTYLVSPRVAQRGKSQTREPTAEEMAESQAAVGAMLAEEKALRESKK